MSNEDNRQKEIDIVSKTIYNEARGEGKEGMNLVADTIRNREQANKSYLGGSDLEKICNKGYEGARGKDPNPIHPGDKVAFEHSRQLAEKLVNGNYQAGTNYTHFASSRNSFKKMEDKGGLNFQEQVGNHYFFTEKGVAPTNSGALRNASSNTSGGSTFGGNGGSSNTQGGCTLF